MHLKLIASDLDGTLLPPGGSLSPRTKAAFRLAREAGVRVTLASGRTFDASSKYALELGVNAPLICCNGAVIRDVYSGEVLGDVRVPLEIMTDCVTYCQSRGWQVVLFLEDRHYFARPPVRRDSAALERLFDREPVDDLLRLLQGPAVKCIVVGDSEHSSEEQMRDLQAGLGNRMTFLRSHPLLVEGLPLGTSKGQGLAALAAHLGFERSTTVAIGDNDNDAEMIEWAGLGLAMGNATARVLSLAAQVLPPVWDDGAAWGIEHLVLNGRQAIAGIGRVSPKC